MSKTAKVRIAVAVGRDGYWAAYGFARSNGGAADEEAWDVILDMVDDNEARYWVTADLPIPDAAEIAGMAEKAE